MKSNQELVELCDAARVAGRIGLDTEFIRERTYYPKLALVQVVVGEHIALIDPLISLDLTPIDELLMDPLVVKVLHAATQDLEIFYYRIGQPPVGIFDTQIAAALVGLGNQVSYAKAVDSVLGEQLDKGSQYTDWLRRPLTEKQENYAADDVRYLLPLHDELYGRITEMGRVKALEQELKRLSKKSRYQLDDAALVSKIKGSKGLKGKGKNVLRRLALWREDAAQDRNIPRRWVVPDDALVALARECPQSHQALADIRGLHPKEAKRSGDTLLAAIIKGSAEPEVKQKTKSRPPLDAEGELIADCAFALLKVLCHKHSISPVTVASSADVQLLVRYYVNDLMPQLDIPLMTGWRAEMFGSPLLEFLAGQRALRINTDNGHLVLD